MILAIDAGTTSIRGLIFNDRGLCQFSSQKETVPSFLPDQRVEQDPRVWRDALFSILTESSLFLTERNRSLDGITVTAFRSPVFPLSRSGEPLAPAIMWQDKRTDPLCREHADINEHCYQTTGLPVRSVFSAVKMEWFHRHRPDLFDKAWKMSGIYDYLLYLLTGRFVTDHSIASRSNLFKLRTREWDQDMLDAFDLRREHLAELCPPASVCGTLSDESARLTGLPSGIPVVTGGGDQQCASLGLGITDPGRYSITTGTGAYVMAVSNEALIDPERKLYRNCAAIPDKYILEASLLTAGTVHRWFCEAFLPHIDNSKERYATLDRDILDSLPGAGGVLLIPHFKSAAIDAKEDYKGIFSGLDLNSSRGDMGRAILEGIACELESLMKSMEDLSGSCSSVNVSGGLNNFPLYRQIQADIYGKELLCPSETEATARGAWMNAMMALGKVEDYNCLIPEQEATRVLPDPKNTDTYRELKERRRKLLSALKG